MSKNELKEKLAEIVYDEGKDCEDIWYCKDAIAMWIVEYLEDEGLVEFDY